MLSVDTENLHLNMILLHEDSLMKDERKKREVHPNGTSHQWVLLWHKTVAICCFVRPQDLQLWWVSVCMCVWVRVLNFEFEIVYLDALKWLFHVRWALHYSIRWFLLCKIDKGDIFGSTCHFYALRLQCSHIQNFFVHLPMEA